MNIVIMNVVWEARARLKIDIELRKRFDCGYLLKWKQKRTVYFITGNNLFDSFYFLNMIWYVLPWIIRRMRALNSPGMVIGGKGGQSTFNNLSVFRLLNSVSSESKKKQDSQMEIKTAMWFLWFPSMYERRNLMVKCVAVFSAFLLSWFTI